MQNRGTRRFSVDFSLGSWMGVVIFRLKESPSDEELCKMIEKKVQISELESFSLLDYTIWPKISYSNF